MSAESLALGMGAVGVNTILADRAAERNQRYYRQNMQANYEISQQAQRNAALNEVEGLRAAGLSPALANGAAGAPQVTAQGGTEQPAQFDPSNVLLMAQVKNLEAQTAKTEAETKAVTESIPKTHADTAKAWSEVRKLDIEADREKLSLKERQDYNQYVSEAMPSLVDMVVQFPGVAESNPKAYEWLLHLGYDKPSSAGALQAISDWVATYGSNAENLRKSIVETFNTAQEKHKLDLGLEKSQVDKIASEISTMSATVKKLMSDVEVNGSQISLNESKRSEIDAHIKVLEKQVAELTQAIETSKADEKLKKQLANASYYNKSNQGQQAAAGDSKALFWSQLQRLQDFLGSFVSTAENVVK